MRCRKRCPIIFQALFIFGQNSLYATLIYNYLHLWLHGVLFLEVWILRRSLTDSRRFLARLTIKKPLLSRRKLMLFRSLVWHYSRQTLINTGHSILVRVCNKAAPTEQLALQSWSSHDTASVLSTLYHVHNRLWSLLLVSSKDLLIWHGVLFTRTLFGTYKIAIQHQLAFEARAGISRCHTWKGSRWTSGKQFQNYSCVLTPPE